MTFRAWSDEVAATGLTNAGAGLSYQGDLRLAVGPDLTRYIFYRTIHDNVYGALMYITRPTYSATWSAPVALVDRTDLWYGDVWAIQWSCGDVDDLGVPHVLYAATAAGIDGGVFQYVLRVYYDDTVVFEDIRNDYVRYRSLSGYLCAHGGTPVYQYTLRYQSFPDFTLKLIDETGGTLYTYSGIFAEGEHWCANGPGGVTRVWHDVTDNTWHTNFGALPWDDGDVEACASVKDALDRIHVAGVAIATGLPVYGLYDGGWTTQDLDDDEVLLSHDYDHNNDFVHVGLTPLAGRPWAMWDTSDDGVRCAAVLPTLDVATHAYPVYPSNYWARIISDSIIGMCLDDGAREIDYVEYRLATFSSWSVL